jgi:F-type H+-transporting ATPase subunit b
MLIVLLILIQIIIFVVLILMFRRIMTKNVVQATTHLEEMSQEYTEKEKEISKRLQEAKQKAQETVLRAQSEAEKRKAQIIKDAEEERDSILKQARSQSEEVIQHADKSRQLLLAEIDERIAKAAILKACELIESSLSDEFKKEVHKRWVEDLVDSGFKGIGNLKIPENIKEAKVVSAFSLTDEQRKTISKKLKETLDRDVKLKEENDPKIVAGLIIKVGSLVLDGSLKNKIQEKARDA